MAGQWLHRSRIVTWPGLLMVAATMSGCLLHGARPHSEPLIAAGDSVRVTSSEPGYEHVFTGVVFSLSYGANSCIAVSVPPGSISPGDQYAALYVFSRETSHIELERWRPSGRGAASWTIIPFADPEAGLPRCIVGTSHQ